MLAAQEAERLHRQVLAWKEASAGPESVAAGTSLNSLGVLARRRGALAEAEALLRRALAIREAQPHPRDAFDASVTRDELGCCLQAAGRAAEAREVRLRRGPAGLVCSHARCSKTPAQAGAPLKACTRCWAIGCAPAWATARQRPLRAAARGRRSAVVRARVRGLASQHSPAPPPPRRYCCKECQRADWTAGHKAVCEPHPELQPQA